MLDLLIKNGLVVDGSGSPAVPCDLGVKEGKIVALGRLDIEAARVIDAAGLVVAPGLIDSHSHSELRLLTEPVAEAKLRQGITTEILGQDGLSVAPIGENTRFYRQLLAGLLGDPDIPWDWRTVDGYLNRLAAHGLPLNVAYLVPHGMLRILAMGMDDRPALASEIETMRRLLAEAMGEGALGLSTGMIYPPCSFAPDEELVALTAEAARHGGSFVIHMRDEGQWLVESIQQTLAICRRSGAHLHISHLKSFGKANWHKADQVLAMIEQARKEGVSVSADQYPYTAGCTVLTACLPHWTMAGGTEACLKRLVEQRDEIKEWFRKDITVWDNRSISIGWENIIVTAVKTDANRWVEGLSIAQIAEQRGVDPVDALCDILVEEQLAVTHIMFYGCEENVVRYMKHPLTMICTDGIYGGRPHPRLYGSFPRVLGRYVREQQVLTLEEAVYKMTGLPAKTFGFAGRGLLAEGFVADIVLFDPQTIADRATYECPEQYPTGIPYVIVNGQIVIDKGAYTGAKAGQALRR